MSLKESMSRPESKRNVRERTNGRPSILQRFYLAEAALNKSAAGASGDRAFPQVFTSKMHK